MSLSSLLSAAESAVEKSEAAAVAAEEALNAARLAGVHARAALEAAKLTHDLDKKPKSQDGARSSTPPVKPKIDRSSSEAADVSTQGNNILEMLLLNNNNNNVNTSHKDEDGGKSKADKRKCSNCNLYVGLGKYRPCLHGKILLEVTHKTRGMRLKTDGDGWTDEKKNKLCWVKGGDKKNVQIYWNKDRKGKVESYTLFSQGRGKFQFWCKDEEDDPSQMAQIRSMKLCENCEFPPSKCLNGRSVTHVRDQTMGMRVKASETFYISELSGKNAVVVDGKPLSITVRWADDGQEESYHLITRGQSNFKFDCLTPSSSFKRTKKLTKSLPTPALTDACKNYALRLPYRTTTSEIWTHFSGPGEKHRILFNASENIDLLGLGLLVAKKIDKVIVNISQPKDKGQYRLIYNENFENVPSSDSTTILQFGKSVPVSSEKIYLIGLTMIGGASVVGHGGEEFVIVEKDCGKTILLKFDDYKHKDDVQGQTTDVEKGVIEKLYVN